jgi:hypothetical protein
LHLIDTERATRLIIQCIVMTSEQAFNPALLVVDLQEDFCPPVSGNLHHRRSPMLDISLRLDGF